MTEEDISKLLKVLVPLLFLLIPLLARVLKRAPGATPPRSDPGRHAAPGRERGQQRPSLADWIEEVRRSAEEESRRRTDGPTQPREIESPPAAEPVAVAPPVRPRVRPPEPPPVKPRSRSAPAPQRDSDDETGSREGVQSIKPAQLVSRVPLAVRAARSRRSRADLAPGDLRRAIILSEILRAPVARRARHSGAPWRDTR